MDQVGSKLCFLLRCIFVLTGFVLAGTFSLPFYSMGRLFIYGAHLFYCSLTLHPKMTIRLGDLV